MLRHTYYVCWGCVCVYLFISAAAQRIKQPTTTQKIKEITIACAIFMPVLQSLFPLRWRDYDDDVRKTKTSTTTTKLLLDYNTFYLDFLILLFILSSSILHHHRHHQHTTTQHSDPPHHIKHICSRLVEL